MVRPPACEVPQDVPDRVAGAGIHGRGQFVEEEQLWIVEQGEGDEHPLPLASGELLDAGGRLVRQPQFAENLVHVPRVRVKGREGAQRLPHGEPRNERRLLQLGSHARREQTPVPDGIQSEDADLTGGRPIDPLQQVEQGGLPGAVRSE